MYVVMLLLPYIVSRISADCNVPFVELCDIPANSCKYWNYECSELDRLIIDLSISAGNAQLYIAITTGTADVCRSAVGQGLCGYPLAVSRCQESLRNDYTSGMCSLVIHNNNSADIYVNGMVRSDMIIPISPTAGLGIITTIAVSLGMCSLAIVWTACLHCANTKNSISKVATTVNLSEIEEESISDIKAAHVYPPDINEFPDYDHDEFPEYRHDATSHESIAL